MERRHETGVEGNLVKLNLRKCECGHVWVSPQQASKTGTAVSGWYPSVNELRKLIEQDINIDPVIRISSSRRGKIVCPACK